MAKVFVENQEKEYEEMFIDQGWTTTANPYSADVICFVGGADVSPSMYMEENTFSSSYAPLDCASVGLWAQTRNPNVLHVGICRGGQFLNVMEGGRMKQHINGHGLGGTHPLEYNGKVYNVTSTHHQEMIPNNTEPFCAEDGVIEAVVYPSSFCFQPHPEYEGADETRELFFQMLEDYYGLRG